MAFSFIALAEGNGAASSATLDCSSSLNVASGDLLVALVSHEDATIRTVAVAKDSGSPANTFTFDAGEIVNSAAAVNSAMGYVLSAAADATAVFRVTFGAATVYRNIFVLQFRPDAGETVTKDDSNVGEADDSSPITGVISTTGDDEVVVAGVVHEGIGTVSSELINSGAAIEPAGSPNANDVTVWYRILSAPFSNGTASATATSSARWVCTVMAFKAAAGGVRKWILGRP